MVPVLSLIPASHTPYRFIRDITIRILAELFVSHINSLVVVLLRVALSLCNFHLCYFNLAEKQEFKVPRGPTPGKLSVFA